MADMSTYLADGLRNLLFRGLAFSPGTTRYISAHTASPGLTGANEVVNGSYARVQIDASTTNWTDEVTVGQTKNAVAITFPTSWDATVTHLGVWDAATVGNFIAKATLTAPVDVDSADTFSIPVGQATFTFV